MTATFLDDTLSMVGTPQTIGPVTAADRGGLTGFRHRSVLGLVPAGARTIQIDLRMAWTDGYNDGYADNLSLALTPGGHALYLPLINR